MQSLKIVDYIAAGITEIYMEEHAATAFRRIIGTGVPPTPLVGCDQRPKGLTNQGCSLGKTMSLTYYVPDAKKFCA